MGKASKVPVFKVPATEILNRMRRIQRELQHHEIDALFIVQRVDLFYFSGTAQDGVLFIPAEGKPLLIIKKYIDRARSESPLEDITEMKSFREIPGLIKAFYGRLPRVLGFEFDVVPVNDFNYYKTLFPLQEYFDGSRLILRVRMIKSNWEIDQMDIAAELSRKTFDFMRGSIHSGVTEVEFASEFEMFSREQGHGARLRIRGYRSEGYPWHVWSAVNSIEGTSLKTSHGAGRKRLARNEPIMIELRIVLNGYHMAETRMFAIKAMPDRSRAASQVAIQAHDGLLAKTRPGMGVDELVEQSLAMSEDLKRAGVSHDPATDRVSLIGDGIGLELREPPRITSIEMDLLEAGMVFALDSTVALENTFAAAIKSVILVQKSGARLISRVPVEIFTV